MNPPGLGPTLQEFKVGGAGLPGAPGSWGSGDEDFGDDARMWVQKTPRTGDMSAIRGWRPPLATGLRSP